MLLSPPLPFPLSTTPPLPSSLDPAATVRLLHSSAARRDRNLTSSLHATISKSGLLHSNLLLANSLLDAYSKCGHLNYAQKLFDRMPNRDVVSWTSMISAYCHNGLPAAAVDVFLDLLASEKDSLAPNEFTVAALLRACSEVGDEKMGPVVHGYLLTNGFLRDAFVFNSLINMYSKLGSLSSAEKLLRGLHCRDVVSWSVVISGCVHHGMYDKALGLFLMMLQDGVVPNLVTVLSVLRACSLMNEPRNFGWVHDLVVKLGLDGDALVVKSVIEMYSKSGLVGEGLKVMVHSWVENGIGTIDSEAMATLLHGCTISRSFALGKEIHGLLVKHGFFPCTIVENSLMDMYSSYEEVSSANLIFRRMRFRDLVSWNTMISCFLKNDHVSEALQHLTELNAESDHGDLKPDFITMLISIQACSKIASLQLGQVLHGYLVRSGFDSDVFISNALIDMYAKSGRIDFAEKIFKEMDLKDISSWNSMIQAHGIHGDGNSALQVFFELKESKEHTPNAITFTSIISACSHSGLIKEGYECFKSMQRDYRLEPSMEHYASMVDLFGRSGKFKEAEHFIKEMPVEPDSGVWGSLLGASAILGNVEVAERAAAKLSVLEPGGTVWRVALSNAYARARRWEDVGKLRAEMRRAESRKEAGWSSIQINGRGSIKFIVGDTRHPETERIYEVWSCIQKHITDSS